MNEITVALSLAEAELVLRALRYATATTNEFPLLESVIDTIQFAVNPPADDGEGDPFRTDAEADADALASAGFGTDEDYGSEAQHDFYSPWEDDQY
jgi:hypothetical protein